MFSMTLPWGLCLLLIPSFHWKVCDLINGLNSLSLGHTVLVESDDVSLCNFQVTGIALQIQNTTSKTCHQPSTISSEQGAVTSDAEGNKLWFSQLTEVCFEMMILC